MKVLSRQYGEQMRREEECQIGLQVIHLLIIDMLGRKTTQANIFRNKVFHDFKYRPVVTSLAKSVAWLALACFSVGIAVGSVVLITDKPQEWQLVFILVVCLQLLLELFFTILDCISWHYVLPRAIRFDLLRAIRILMRSIDHSLSCAAYWKENGRTFPLLESTSYFFVSRQVAKLFPKVFESSIVLSYMSIFPSGRLAQHFQAPEAMLVDARMSLLEGFMQKLSLSVYLRAYSFFLGNFPCNVQFVFIRIFESLVLFGFLQLFLKIHENSVLVLVPLCLLVFFVIGRRIRWRNKHPLVVPLSYISTIMNRNENDGNQCDPSVSSRGSRRKNSLPKKSGSNDGDKKNVSRERRSSLDSIIDDEDDIYAFDEQDMLEYNVDDSSGELLSLVDDDAVDEVAKLIAESSGVSMDVARNIAKKELERGYDSAKASNNLENDVDSHFPDATVEKISKPSSSKFSYTDSVLARASTNNYSSPWSAVRSSVSSGPSMSNVVQSSIDAQRSALELAKRIELSRSTSAVEGYEHTAGRSKFVDAAMQQDVMDLVGSEDSDFDFNDSENELRGASPNLYP